MVRAAPPGLLRKSVGKSLVRLLGNGAGGTSRWSVSGLASPWRPALRPWLRCPRTQDARLAPWPPPGAGEQMDSSDRGRPRWPYDPLGDGTQSDHHGQWWPCPRQGRVVTNEAIGRVDSPGMRAGHPRRAMVVAYRPRDWRSRADRERTRDSCLPKHPCRWQPVNGCGITRRLRPRR